MMNEMLAANPVNIHTHGLIVEPRKADESDPTWGDNVYVLGYPSGKLPSMVDSDETATDKPIQYDIYISDRPPLGHVLVPSPCPRERSDREAQLAEDVVRRDIPASRVHDVRQPVDGERAQASASSTLFRIV